MNVQAAAQPVTTDRGATAFGLLLLLAVVAAGTLLDGAAQDAFNAPKRLVVLLCAVLGALLLLWRSEAAAAQPKLATMPAAASWIARLAIALVALLVIATLASPQPALALDALRAGLLLALFVLLGASPLLQPAWRRRLLWTALLVCAGNALLSTLQWCGLDLPWLAATRLGGRFSSTAQLGNEGYVALAAALAATASLALTCNREVRPALRWWAALLALIGLTAILLNRQLTSLLAFAAGALVLLCLRLRWRAAIRVGLALVLVTATAALLPALRTQTFARAGDVAVWQERTTYRVAAWAATLEMVADRPWLGQGPGAFARESQRWRQAAELRWRQRLLPPPTANAFAEAHNEYLQLAAEAGVPALLCGLLALALLLDGLFRLAMRRNDPEPALLLAVLVGGACAALAWFPLQIPLTGLLLLLALGRAWRLLADAESSS